MHRFAALANAILSMLPSDWSERRTAQGYRMLQANAILQGRYRVVRLLGQGGMGAVYEALDTRLKSTVALKQTLVTGDQLRRQFEREAQLLSGLQHPALPHVIDYFGEENGEFLVM